MIDVGYFNAIDVKPVFIRSPSTDYDVITKTGDGGNSWQGPQGLTNIPSPSRISFDFVGADRANTQWRFSLGYPPRPNDFCRFYGNGTWPQFDLNHCWSRRRHFDFKHRLGIIPQKVDLHVTQTRRHIGQLKTTIQIRGCSAYFPLQDDACKWNRFIGLLIGNAAPNDPRRLSPNRFRAQQ